MFVYEIIEKKIIDYAEIVVVLFENCNLRCVMCPQDHETLNNISEESILSKVDPLINWINKNDSKYVKLHIMGGEIFQDFLLEKNYLNTYQKFMNEIVNKVEDKNKNIVFNFVTNLVFTKSDLVLNFLEKNNLMISTSYDSAGRFNIDDLKIFKKNIEIFKNKISMISCIMTAQSIKSVKTDDYFSYLYDNFLIDWDSLWPSKYDKLNRLLMPKESELFDFYKWLIDNYPNCLNVEHFITEKPLMKMTCTRGNNMTILQDNTIPRGCSGSAFVQDRKTSDENVQEVVLNFFKTYNCFECQYFKKCPFTCFVKQDYKYIEHDLGDCVFKKTFEYVEEKNKND
jgi:hypothetical protein